MRYWFPLGPAGQAGLQDDDLLLSLGPIEATEQAPGAAAESINTVLVREGPHALGRCLALTVMLVAAAQIRDEVSVTLNVLRAERTVTVQLVPHRWSGQGLLGCRLIPL